MNDPKTPKAWANFLVRAWGSNFPVRVESIALEYSKRFSDPIAKIIKADVNTFEGALYHRPKNNHWFILYNPNIHEEGRINFTLGHEFGHYLNHREIIRAGQGSIECSQQAVLGVDIDDAHKMECEADEFASYLLMPMDDFRRQTDRQRMTLDLLRHCKERYAVSFTAAARKWIEFTDQRAVLVIGIDEHVLWARSSDSAFKSYIYYKKGAPLPPASLAMQPGLSGAGCSTGIDLPAGVWGQEPVREMTIFADRYDLTISLLLFPKEAMPRAEIDEEPVSDTLDLIERRGRA
jgi:Zn-dependent peptidase ImmA (M78 family)